MNGIKRLGWSIVMLGIGCIVQVALSGGAGAADQLESKTTSKKDDGMQAFMRNIKVDGASITIQSGIYKVASGALEVKTPATFALDPAEIVTVKDESILVSPKKPESWHSGTPLAGSATYGVNGAGCYVPDSIGMSKTPGGPKLVEGRDYLIAPEHATVGLAPGSKLSTKKPVLVSYQYSLLRLDSIVVDAQGQAHLIKGKSHVAQPKPPETPAGMTHLLNIFRPYHARTIATDDIYPILERPDQGVTHTTRGRIPKTLAKIKASHAVRIVCLGDSVTVGGDASSPELIYSELFRRSMMKKYSPPSPFGVPMVSINIINESYGGSSSSHWLRIGPLKNYLNEHPEMIGNIQERINFQRVLEVKPDLVTIEFVNDAPFAREVLEELYGKMTQELQAIGAEIILITPHFCALEMMQTTSERMGETRPYIQFIYEFADKHNLAVADASSRWAHLWKEGIPYTTLLANTFNHPNDQGHRLFAEELMKCFE